MVDFLFRQILKLAISVMTLYVPQDKWQEILDNYPTQAERLKDKKLNGWQLTTIVSERTGQVHTCFRYPPSTDSIVPDTTEKKTLLMLHGFSSDGGVFFNLKPLADTYNLIAYNFPEKTDNYTGSIRDFAFLLDDFCAALHLDTIDLLGFSIGGVIAPYFTAHTEKVRVNHLILVSTYTHGATKSILIQLRKLADKLLAFPDYKLFYLLSLGRKSSNRQKNDGSSSGVVVTKYIDWYRQVLKALYWYDGTVDAKKITCPVLILLGTKDRLITVKEAETTKKYIPQAKIFTLKNGEHYMIHSNADDCIRIMRKEL